MKMLCYDPAKYERVFVGKVASKADLYKLFMELRDEVLDGEVVVELWRVATNEERSNLVAQRRREFFSS